MARPPGLIERRGTGWRVRIRIDGDRHVYGPRNVPLLRHGSREEVEAWVWDEYRRLARQAKANADGRAGNIRFSELVQRWRELELSGLNPGGASAYEDSLKPIETFFVERKEDPPIRNIKPADIKEFLPGAAPRGGFATRRSRGVFGVRRPLRSLSLSISRTGRSRGRDVIAPSNDSSDPSPSLRPPAPPPPPRRCRPAPPPPRGGGSYRRCRSARPRA